MLSGESVRDFSLAWRSRTASYFGESSLIPFLAPWEYWSFVGTAYQIPPEEQRRRVETYEAFVEAGSVTRSGKKYVRDFSQGNRKKIGPVAALMTRPDLLVLDEPFANLDPRSRSQLAVLLHDLNRRFGTTIIASSHDLVDVADLSTRMLLIEDGRITSDMASGPGTLELIRNRLTASEEKPA